MALKSMKTTKADKAAREKEWKTCSPSSEDYPYELRITLNNDSLKKLGMTKLPKAGAEVMLTAACSVISTSVSERNGKAERRLELQIEKLDVDAGKESLEDAISDAVDEAGEE